jgi:hypothetical protein
VSVRVYDLAHTRAGVPRPASLAAPELVADAQRQFTWRDNKRDAVFGRAAAPFAQTGRYDLICAVTHHIDVAAGIRVGVQLKLIARKDNAKRAPPTRNKCDIAVGPDFSTANEYCAGAYSTGYCAVTNGKGGADGRTAGTGALPDPFTIEGSGSACQQC